uniref:protein-tyrosine-phosphatase n=1 Tax=Parastrongyloides trichosuri TaxID=131310 RepID=A0A0N5A1K6_PARTI
MTSKESINVLDSSIPTDTCILIQNQCTASITSKIETNHKVDKDNNLSKNNYYTQSLTKSCSIVSLKPLTKFEHGRVRKGLYDITHKKHNLLNNHDQQNLTMNYDANKISMNKCNTIVSHNKRKCHDSSDDDISTMKKQKIVLEESELISITENKNDLSTIIEEESSSLLKTNFSSINCLPVKHKLNIDNDESPRSRNQGINKYRNTKASTFSAISVSSTIESYIDDHTIYSLPLVKSPQIHSQAFGSISGDTLKNIILNDDEINEKYIIIDCRYPFEYNGGHIRGAINFYQTEGISEIFFPTDKKKAKEIENKIPIFYCEFSQKRGPTMANCLRKSDRERNVYPNLKYKEIYVLDRGYKRFFDVDKHHSFCEPSGYVRMLDKNYSNELKKYSIYHKSKRNKNKRIIKKIFQACCENGLCQSFDSPESMYGLQCCGDNLMNMVNQICCDDVIHSRSSGALYVEKCCGNQTLSNKQTCCNNIVSNIPNGICCGDTAFPVSPNIKCCNNVLHKNVDANSQCCGSNVYDGGIDQMCCGNTVYNKTDYDSCCVNTQLNITFYNPYNSKSQKCCSTPITISSTSKCCYLHMNNSFIPTVYNSTGQCCSYPYTKIGTKVNNTCSVV